MHSPGGDQRETDGAPSVALASAWVESLPYRIWRANQVLNRRVLAAIDGMDATITQLGILVHLDELGPMSSSELARLLGLTPQSTTTAMKWIEELGWVSRQRHPSHGRIILYQLTAVGSQAADEGRRRLADVNRHLDVLLPRDQREALDAAISAISGGPQTLP